MEYVYCLAFQMLGSNPQHSLRSIGWGSYNTEKTRTKSSTLLMGVVAELAFYALSKGTSDRSVWLVLIRVFGPKDCGS